MHTKYSESVPVACPPAGRKGTTATLNSLLNLPIGAAACLQKEPLALAAVTSLQSIDSGGSLALSTALETSGPDLWPPGTRPTSCKATEEAGSGSCASLAGTRRRWTTRGATPVRHSSHRMTGRRLWCAGPPTGCRSCWTTLLICRTAPDPCRPASRH